MKLRHVSARDQQEGLLRLFVTDADFYFCQIEIFLQVNRVARRKHSHAVNPPPTRNYYGAHWPCDLAIR